MSKEKFDNLIRNFKEEQSDIENLIFIIGSKDLTTCKAVIAWKNTKSKLDFSKCDESIKDDWNYIWQFCFYDKQQFSMFCDLPVKEGEQLFERIKMLKLIYPDGTVNDAASGIIKSILKQAITKLTGTKKTTN